MEAATRWYLLKSFTSLLTVYGLTVLLLSLGATWCCHRYGYVAEMPLTFLGSGIFFPISFGYHSFACPALYVCGYHT